MLAHTMSTRAVFAVKCVRGFFVFDRVSVRSSSRAIATRSNDRSIATMASRHRAYPRRDRVDDERWVIARVAFDDDV